MKVCSNCGVELEYIFEYDLYVHARTADYLCEYTKAREQTYAEPDA